MHTRLDFGGPFRGIVFAVNRAQSCPQHAAQSERPNIVARLTFPRNAAGDEERIFVGERLRT